MLGFAVDQKVHSYEVTAQPNLHLSERIKNEGVMEI